MTKSELIQKISEENNELSKSLVEKAVQTILDEITLTLTKGGKVELRRFGVFEVRKRRARRGRDPRNGKSISVPPKVVPFFRAGKNMRQSINQDTP